MPEILSLSFILLMRLASEISVQVPVFFLFLFFPHFGLSLMIPFTLSFLKHFFYFTPLFVFHRFHSVLEHIHSGYSEVLGPQLGCCSWGLLY